MPVKLFEQGFDDDPLNKGPIVNQSLDRFVKFELLQVNLLLSPKQRRYFGSNQRPCILVFR